MARIFELLDGLVLGDFILHGLFRPLLLAAGAQLLPPVRRCLEGTADRIGHGLEGEARHAHGRAEGGSARAGGRVDHAAGRAAHIAGADGFHAGLVRQDAGHQAAGLLRRLDAAEDQHELGDGVQERLLFKEHQVRTDHDGQIDEQ